MRRATILALISSAIPAVTYAQQAPAIDQSGDPCSTLVATIQSQPNAELPTTLDQAQELRQANNTRGCSDALGSIRTALTNQQLSGQQPMAEPNAGGAVAQAQAEVTVHQGAPEITIMQPAPTITIDVPRPEIVVRMPEPELSVQTNQPQTANASVEPIVHYEQAEPRVVINRAEGDPTVRFEQTSAGQQLVAGAAGGPASNAAPGGIAPLQPGQTNVQQPQQQAALQSSGQNQPSSGVSAADVTAGEVVGMVVVDETGQTIGTVDQIVHFTPDNQDFVVIRYEAGNSNQKMIGVALNDTRLNSDNIVVAGTAQELQSFPTWEPGAGYTSVPDGERIDIPTGG